MSMEPPTRRRFLRGVIGRWGDWVTPTGPLLGGLSAVAFLVPGVVFLVLLALWGTAGLSDAGVVAVVITGVLVALGLVGGIFLLLFGAPYEVWQRDVAGLQERVRTVAWLEELERHQREHPEEYLHLVVEEVDFSLSAGYTARDQFRLSFQFDSGLVYELVSQRVFVTVNIDGAPTLESWEYPDRLVVPAGKRTSLSTQFLPVRGELFTKEVENARSKGKVSATVKVSLEVEGMATPITKEHGSKTYIVKT